MDGGKAGGGSGLGWRVEGSAALVRGGGFSGSGQGWRVQRAQVRVSYNKEHSAFPSPLLLLWLEVCSSRRGKSVIKHVPHAGAGGLEVWALVSGFSLSSETAAGASQPGGVFACPSSVGGMAFLLIHALHVPPTVLHISTYVLRTYYTYQHMYYTSFVYCTGYRSAVVF